MTELNWIHHLDRGTAGDLTLLLLHGTGGNERQLLSLGRQVAPTATLLGVRGRSLEEGFPRYFRRFSAVEYDQDQIRSEAAALAQFVTEAAQTYDLNPARFVALGYSNGANIALATLALHPQTFLGAALLRPVMPLDEPPATDLGGVSALVLHGAHDPYAAHAGPVVPYLKTHGAQVQAHLLNAGHELGGEDLHLASDWLAQLA
ncbi:alpha/beta hydrolase [Deinococcus navajonensis]|uniref:Alpha/beta hydrolase n=1 Tax=Deinococcus navajonensis TaxID=309884 RepID=A0ABV8XIK2_9DEIO